MIYFVIVFFNLIFLKNYLFIGRLYNLYDYPDKRKTLNTNSSVGRFNSLPQFNFLYVVLIFFEFSYNYFSNEELVVFISIRHYFLF